MVYGQSAPSCDPLISLILQLMKIHELKKKLNTCKSLNFTLTVTVKLPDLGN